MEIFGLPSRPDKALIAWMRDPGNPRSATALSLNGVRLATARGTTSPGAWEEEQFFKKLGDSIQGKSVLFAATIDVDVGGDREYQ